MKVSIGSDHRGVEQREIVAQAVKGAGHSVVDCGPATSDEPCDYPDIAVEVAKQVAAGTVDRGILLCGTGIGVSIAANKVKGIRAAVCCDAATARLSIEHNNANVLCLAASKSESEFCEIISAWFEAEFEGGRHERRVNKIMDIEKR